MFWSSFWTFCTHRWGEHVLLIHCSTFGVSPLLVSTAISLIQDSPSPVMAFTRTRPHPEMSTVPPTHMELKPSPNISRCLTHPISSYTPSIRNHSQTVSLLLSKRTLFFQLPFWFKNPENHLPRNLSPSLKTHLLGQDLCPQGLRGNTLLLSSPFMLHRITGIIEISCPI